MAVPTNFCVREAHNFFCAAAEEVPCTRRAGWWYILVARLENIIAPGRRAKDFASPDMVRLTQNSVRSLRPVDDFQNGATETNC